MLIGVKPPGISGSKAAIKRAISEMPDTSSSTSESVADVGLLATAKRSSNLANAGRVSKRISPVVSSNSAINVSESVKRLMA